MLLSRLAARAWQLVYSIVALLGFYLYVTGYGDARQLLVYVAPSWLRYVAALLMLPAPALRPRLGAAWTHPGGLAGVR